MKKLFKNFASQTGRFRLRNEIPATEPAGEEGTGGLKLVTVFIAVLALHVLVIGSISAYHFFKGSPKDAVASTTATTPDATAPEVASTTPDATAEKPTDAAMASKDGTPTTDTSSVAEEPIPTPAISTTPETPAPAVAQNGAPTTPAPVAPLAPVAPKPVAAAAPAVASTIYVVKKGDTMRHLAKVHGITIAQLKAENGIKGNALHVGEKLTFRGAAPASATSNAATSVAAVSSSAVSVSGKTYKVAKGDTLTHIAKSFNTSAAAIMAANKLSDPRKLRIGTVLQIPGKATAQSAHVVPAASPSHTQSGSSLAINQ